MAAWTLRYETLGLSGLSGATTEHCQRKAERQPGAHFVDGTAVREGITQPDVEAEVITDPPNETYQTGYCFRSAKFVLVEKLCDWSDRPF
jgi:hypothetical protein